MKKLLLIIFLGIVLCACTTTKYVDVPVPQVRVEYRDRVSIDTLVQNDSVIIREKGDTVFLEKYKYIYRIKEVKDTINVTDTITVVQTVEVTKEISKLHNWQVILMILGGAGVALMGYKFVNLIRK